MIGLIIETSTERGVVAVFNGQYCVFEEKLPFGLQNSQSLLPILQEKLKEHAFKLGDLSFIAVGIGPGSYTGIRVGATIAKSLAFVLQIPLIGLCTLDTFVSEKEGSFAVLIDAKIGGVYLQGGYLKKDRVETIIKPGAYSLPEAAEKLLGIESIVTPNGEKILPKLQALQPVKWEVYECYPNAQHMMTLAQRKLLNGDYLEDQSLELLYMRKTQAEIEKGY